MGNGFRSIDKPESYTVKHWRVQDFKLGDKYTYILSPEKINQFLEVTDEKEFLEFYKLSRNGYMYKITES